MKSKKIMVAGVSVAGLVMAAGIVYAVTTFHVRPAKYDPDNTHTVQSRWFKQIGEPDSFVDPAGRNVHYGLLLSKNTATTTNSAAFAVISGFSKKQPVTLTDIGYDIRNGGHCGNGAPRFNLVTQDDVTHFVGCFFMTDSAGADAGWQRKTFSAADLMDPSKTFPAFAPGDTVTSMSIAFDEGVDTAPDFSGLAILDNVDVNGTVVTGPNSALDIGVE